MPDHLHLLVAGQTATSALRRFTKIAPQRTAVAFARQCSVPLWQPGFFERTLRRDESVNIVAAYIAANPVRAGLVSQADAWPFSGGELLRK